MKKPKTKNQKPKTQTKNKKTKRLVIKVFLILLFLLGSLYLVLPSPDLPQDMPPLPNSVRSTEPGDTTQIANMAAYYTNLSRKEVIDFYFNQFLRFNLRNFPLITYKLNHPPERIREVLRETQQSTYVEEIVHPLRESLFISGFEWNNDPFTPPKGRIKNILIVNGKIYDFKVTLYYQGSGIWQRLLVWWGIWGLGYLLFVQYKKIYAAFRGYC